MVMYKKNFLAHVIFRLDFPTILELGEKLPSEFQSKISDSFPILRETQGINIIISSNKTSEEEKIPAETKTWSFNNKEKTKFVVLSNNSLTLEYNNYYKNFEEFTSDVKKITEALFEEYNIEIIDRVGLRYVDNIKISSGDPLNWEGLINEHLVSSIKFADSKNLTRTMQEIRIEEDEYNLAFRYGIPNTMYPSKIVRKEFSLDTDCFSKEEISKEKIGYFLKIYHDVVKDIFEKSIGEELRTIMNEESESGK